MNRLKFNILSFLLLILISGTAIGQEEHQCNFSCSPTNFAIRFHAAPLLTQLQSDIYKNEDKSRLGFNLGTDLVYYFFNNGKLKSSLSLGLGLSKYNSQHNLNFADSAWAVDVDNQSVFITEKINNLTENQSVLFLEVPVKLGFDYSLSTRLDAYLNLGVSYGLVLKNKYDNSGVLTRTGYYPDFNVLIYDVDVVGSSYFFPKNKLISGNGQFTKQNNISLEAALGVKFKMNTRWSVFGGFKMMQGMQSVKKSQGMMTQSSVSDYQLNSIMNRNDNVTTKAMGGEIGIAINIGRCKNTVVKKTEKVVEEPVVVDNNVTKDTILPVKEVVVVDTIVEKPVKDTVVVVVVVEPKDIPTDVPNSVNIIVTDSRTNKPVKDATIEIKEKEQITQTGVCDENGKAIITVPETKDYIVIVTAKGYVYQYYTVDLSTIRKRANKEFELEPLVKIEKDAALNLNPINFNSGKQDINSEDIETLNLVQRMLSDNPNMIIEVSGHTDSQGDNNTNIQLSLKRAQSIIDYLVSKGVNPKQLTPLACGSSRPVADNATAEGRNKNRRVEFKVLNN